MVSELYSIFAIDIEVNDVFNESYYVQKIGDIPGIGHGEPGGYGGQ